MSLPVSLLEQATWNEPRSQEKIRDWLTGWLTLHRQCGADCAKFCCLQSLAIGELQEQSGTSGRLQASRQNASAIQGTVNGRGRQKIRSMSWTTYRAQKRSQAGAFPQGLASVCIGGFQRRGVLMRVSPYHSSRGPGLSLAQFTNTVYLQNTTCLPVSRTAEAGFTGEIPRLIIQRGNKRGDRTPQTSQGTAVVPSELWPYGCSVALQGVCMEELCLGRIEEQVGYSRDCFPVLKQRQNLQQVTFNRTHVSLWINTELVGKRTTMKRRKEK